MVITGAVIGAVSFGIQAFNSWRNSSNAKKIQACQEAFQREAMRQNYETAMENFQSMSDTRSQILNEEKEESLKLMRDVHCMNLRSIAELSALDKWPLAVMPLVMRDDNFLGNELTMENVFPINIVVGPSTDRNFNNSIWKLVEEELAMRFVRHWNAGNNHPIVFYQDAWKDPYDSMDSVHCSNIHASTQNVPTIVLSPVVTQNGLQIEMAHWNVVGMDVSSSYCRDIILSLAETNHKYQPNVDFAESEINNYVKELSDTLESIIGYMDDQYMWCRYNVVPLLPQMIATRIKANKETADDLYDRYMSMLGSSLKNSQLQIALDLDVVLSYCFFVDKYCNGNRCFSYVCKLFLGEHMLGNSCNDVPSYDINTLEKFLYYIKEHQHSLCVTQEFVDGLQKSIVKEKLFRETISKLRDEGKLYSFSEINLLDQNKSLVADSKSELSIKSADICDNLLERCIKETKADTDRRNWMRPKFKYQVFETFVEIISCLLKEIDNNIYQYKKQVVEECLSVILEGIQKNDALCIKSKSDALEIKLQCKGKVITYIESKSTNTDHSFWQASYIKDDVEKEVLEYCNASLKHWIEYVFMNEDIVKSSITTEEENDINAKMKKLSQMVDKIKESYIIINYSTNII